MKRKKTLVLIIILTVIAAGLYLFFFKNNKVEYSLVKVILGNVAQEVSETGSVKMGEEVNLSFKNTGRIEQIYIKVGDTVELGQNLVKLDTVQLIIQLREAQAVLEVAQAQLDQLLAGATPEEIQVTETAVLNAEITLSDAKQNLEDVEADAEEGLDTAYEDALNTLDVAYLKAYNASNKVNLIQRTYFSGADQESLSVQENKSKIKNNLNQAKSYLDIAKNDPKNENIDSALSEFKTDLSNIYDALSVIREVTEAISYRDTVTSADKTSLDTYKTNINTALTNVVNSQQTISSTKITNESSINTAEAAVSSAEGNLKATKDQLALVKADPSQEEINLYQAQVKQTQAQVNLLQNQIQEATITSPTKGQITKIEKRIGEMTQSTEAVIFLMPVVPFRAEVDIYEEDIVRVKTGNKVGITLSYFSDKAFEGEVISIDPAEKLVEGIVYYKVTIDFKNPPQEIKPGMTADIIIKTVSRENVLIIPEEAVERKDGKVMVQVLNGETLEEREIEIGLIGSDDMVEVISGLTEGEEIAIK